MLKALEGLLNFERLRLWKSPRAPSRFGFPIPNGSRPAGNRPNGRHASDAKGGKRTNSQEALAGAFGRLGQNHKMLVGVFAPTGLRIAISICDPRAAGPWKIRGQAGPALMPESAP
ncbi:hypothetical protein LSM04_005792 [Trypanosoma melophagium]|uniref:uncharacterized protein n=1 Tax=Trypanosoma melophagium TaxID=715481 RepID=UPI00351A00AC|nr:hypothetical protein LSM04_005792 [Trypanosoma melophagium]